MNSRTILAASAMTVAFVMLTTSVQANAELSDFALWPIYVHIPGVGGDVATQGYDGSDGKKWFVADSFSFGVEREMKESGEKGGTEDINIGVGELQECTISKSMDAASANLAQFAINGNSPGQAEIHFIETGGPTDSTGKPIPYLVYKLDRAFVTIWQTSTDDDPDTEDRPTEQVSFGYSKLAAGSNPNDELEPDENNFFSFDLKKKIPWLAPLDDIWASIFPTDRCEPGTVCGRD